MLRRCFSRLSTPALAALEKELRQRKDVWNFEFGDSALTQQMDFHADQKAIPLFHVTDPEGEVLNKEHDPQLSKEECRKIMHTMVKVNQTDHILLGAQRHGRISFYMTGFGEEGSVVGSAAALNDDDYIFMQYREQGLLHYRGYRIDQMIAQCMGNCEDPMKGRQMPIHYGSPELHCQMVSSPLATQIPQAAGAGYAFKLEKSSRCCVCYFGDGAASEGDFHAGVNHAATTGAQTLFFCRNNGYAISTPTKDQYRGDGILPRAIAYGMPCIRVDGNDVLAVYAATKKARSLIFEKKTPVLVEAVAYRVGHHSTSDDSTAYRSKEEIDHMDESFSPIARFEKHMVKKGWWSTDETAQLREETKNLVLTELKRQEKLDLQPPEALFDDTTAQMFPSLARQKEETMAHFQRNRDKYPEYK